MDSSRLVGEIWDLVASLERVTANDLFELTAYDPESAANLKRALIWVALRANQAFLELSRGNL